MARIKHIAGVGDILYTTAEEAFAIAEELELANEKPMRDWEQAMATTDKEMTRQLEEHITNAHSGVAGGKYQQGKYAAKVALRAQKP